MFILSLFWLTCIVGLVAAHFWSISVDWQACSLSIVVLLTTVLKAAFAPTDTRPRIRWIVTQLALYSLLAGAALYLVTRLPAIEMPAPLAGEWVGRWEGLPNITNGGRNASALFQPYQYLPAQPSQQMANACEGTPLAYRIWVRGLKPAATPEAALQPGACVRVRLAQKQETRMLSASQLAWRQRNRIAGVLYVSSGAPPQWLGDSHHWMDQARLAIRKHFIAARGAERGHSLSQLSTLPVLLGLVTGDRALMTPEHWQIFSNTGTSHLMAISGTHVGLLAMFTYVIVRRLASWSMLITSRFPAPHLALVTSWFVALAYSLLAGFSVPTQRTVVMMGVAVLIRLRGRSLLDWRAFWLAAIAVTAWDPLAIFDRGAWLSFFAVAIILWLLQGRLWPLGAVRAWFLIQGGIFIGLIPLLAYAFGGFPWISPVANAVAIPLLGYLVVPAALASTFSLIVMPAVSPYILKPSLWLADCLMWFLGWMERWGGAGYRVPMWSNPTQMALACSLAVVATLWVLAPRGAPGKWIATVMVLPVALGPGFFPRALPAFEWRREHAAIGFMIEDSAHLWWVFQAGLSSRTRQPILQDWLRRTGYAYLWDTHSEKYADWVRSGFVVLRYDKYTPIWGQIALKSPVMTLPCLDSRPSQLSGWRLTPARGAEMDCWLHLEATQSANLGTDQETSILLMPTLSRKAQLSLLDHAELPTPSLILVPAGGINRVLAASLQRLQPKRLAQWPTAARIGGRAASTKATKATQATRNKLALRGIREVPLGERFE
ncbi:Predicted internalization-related competence protein ComEC/Rec2 [gamma proteobacterium HdN1]|nr:Predicted internalization-related competence protein ComEC/Rec2 [gamma proteobacterium HdN1]